VKKADEMSMTSSLLVFKKIKSQFTVRVQIMSSTAILRKEVKDRDISPRAWTVAYLSYSRLFHSGQLDPQSCEINEDLAFTHTHSTLQLTNLTVTDLLSTFLSLSS